MRCVNTKTYVMTEDEFKCIFTFISAWGDEKCESLGNKHTYEKLYALWTPAWDIVMDGE